MTSPPEPVHTIYEPSVLRLDPRAVPTVRAAFAEALGILLPHIQAMQQDAVITEDWLGDDDSQGLREFYNEQVMRSPDGPFSAMVKYGAMLKDIHDQLLAAETEYRRVEGENSQLWGRA